jgi:predicted ribosome quality control (RQC) complex YloA/Tae2 family protein
MEQKASGKAKEDRPYEGHRVRELLGPGGFTILYGETAEANDYLTLRVAKPNDYWLHLRGGVSAHVVIQTGNHPEKVQKEVLLFAAKVVVQHSPSKHAGYVPVDYTLKKHVRKPRGAPKGTALYTHEKTLHIES